MNYFEFYDIPVSLQPDQKKLREAFIAKSKAFHPDYHTLTDQANQSVVLEISTLNNMAYKTLSNSDLLIKYVLTLFDLLEEGKDSVPQDFLMDMMDLNEEIIDVKMDSNPESLNLVTTKISSLLSSLQKDVQVLLDDWDGKNISDLIKVKEYYLKKKYLKRLEEALF